MKKYISIIAILFSTTHFCYGQYSISGYVDTEQKNKIVYLSLLQYNEEYAISNTQILFSTKADKTGYFEFEGQLLSEKDKFYRIHSNVRNDESARQLVNSDSISNFHNFIFSNNDTIFFPKTKNFWFHNSTNTNIADKEWRKLNKFSKKLTQEFTQNQNITIEAVNSFAKQMKQYTQDSVYSPLVKLLVLPVLKRNAFNLKTDFEKNTDFYRDLQQNLLNDYGKSSYYLQFQDEVSKISYTLIDDKYNSLKKWSYFLGVLILILTVIIFLLLRKIKSLKQENVKDSTQTLTQQEERIAKLICENKTNKEIADELFISLSTVKTHIGNLYAKVNVSNRKGLQSKFKNHTWY